MNEQTKTIIDRARALLAAATPGPWHACGESRGGCDCGNVWSMPTDAPVASATAVWEGGEFAHAAVRANAALIAAAPGLLATLLDALEAADRRAEEAEAQCETSRAEFAALGDHFSRNVLILNDVATQVCCTHFERLPEAVRELVADLHAAEARVADVEAAQKMRAESADPDDETWHTREEYLRRVKAEARVADLESVRIEQAAKLRRHLDEIAELSALHRVAEARESRLDREMLAIWATVRTGDPAPLTEGDVQHAVEDVRRERDALRAEVEKESALRAELTREVQRLRSRVGAVGQVLAENGCDCECDHGFESHDDDCDRCLACRVQGAAMSGGAK